MFWIVIKTLPPHGTLLYILGWPSIKTTRAKIDVGEGSLSVEFDGIIKSFPVQDDSAFLNPFASNIDFASSWWWGKDFSDGWKGGANQLRARLIKQNTVETLSKLGV